MNNLYVSKLPLQAKPEAASGLASTVNAGLVGFEPTTAGLKVRCATWLRYRPIFAQVP